MAHPHQALGPEGFWSAWSIEPAALAGLGLAVLLYGTGLWRLWCAAGTGRAVAPWRAWSFAAGIAVVGIALFSPIDAAAESLFAAHMLQHLLLLLIAPPLLVLGSALLVMLWGLPVDGRRTLGGWWVRRRTLRRIVGALVTPPVAWVLSVVAILIWHLPRLYGAALQNDAVHAAEHFTFLGTGLLFWWVVLRPDGSRRLSPAASVLYLFTAALPNGLLGALLTFAGRPLYHAQSSGAALWGLTPLEDQQLAGLIMWMPGGLVYFTAAAAFFLVWLRREDARIQRRAALFAAGVCIPLLMLPGCRSTGAKVPVGGDSLQTAGPPEAAVESLPAGRVVSGSGFTPVAAVVGLSAPESVRYDPAQDLYFISNFSGTLTAKDNNGFISRFRPDGLMDSLKFIAGGHNGVELNAPTGMAIAGDTLWVADVTKARRFNTRSGAALPVVDLGPFHPRLLNDLEVGPDHSVYITDTGIRFGGNGALHHPGPDRILRIDPHGRVTEAAASRKIEGPNGIAWDSTRHQFLVVSFTGKKIYRWSPERSTVAAVVEGAGKWDGIEVLRDGRALVTSWADSSLYVLDGSQLTRAISALPEPADIGIDTRRNRVAIPLSSENRVELWTIPAHH